MKADFYMGQGDAPIWSGTFTDGAGNPVLIQGAALTMTMTPISGGADLTLTPNGTVVNDDDGTLPQRGKVHRQFATADSAVPGVYLVKITASLAGKPITYPDSGYLLFEVGPTAASQQHRYLGAEELKATMNLSGSSFADADVNRAIEAASRGLELAYNDGRQWTIDTQTVRYYTASSTRTVALGDVLKITSVDLDYAWGVDTAFADDALDVSDDPDLWPFGGGTYGVNLPVSAYTLMPRSPLHGLAADGGNGAPFSSLYLSRATTIYRLPLGRDAVRITGTFGWEKVPEGVKWCVGLVAARMIKRNRDAPWGVAAFGADATTAVIRSFDKDPEFQFAMRNGVAKRKRLFV